MFWKRWFKQKTEVATQPQSPSHATEVGIQPQKPSRACVAVKAGVKEEDSGLDMSGWQGRIVKMDDAKELILVAWDSITLRALPPAYLEDCEEKGLGWNEYYLHATDVEPATARDSEREVELVVRELHHCYAWVGIGPEGKEIQAVLKDTKPDNQMAAIKAWEKHLHKALKFPFKAVVSELQTRGRLQSGDKVTVLKITDVHELYGVLVEIRSKYGLSIFPLCDLEHANHKSAMYDRLKAYVVWYANH